MPPYQGKQNDGRHDGIKSGRNGGGRKTLTTTSTRKKYEAPTANHRNVLFASDNTNKDAAEFTDTVRVLARHVSTSATYKHGPALANAMVDLVAPVFVESTRPVRKYYLNTDNISTEIVTDRMSAGTINEPVKDDSDWSIETDQYKRLWAKYDTQVELWQDLNAQGFALVLQHCPDELETELQNQDAWAAIDITRNVVALLILIRDLQYNKNDRKKSIMASVQADFDLYTCSQEKNQSTEDYYKVFTCHSIDVDRSEERR